MCKISRQVENEIVNADFSEFTYTNHNPMHDGLNVNVVRLWMHDGKVMFSRKFVSNGKISGTCIEQQLNDTHEILIAKAIHWGCCGWIAGGHELYSLRDAVNRFLQKQS